jgi:hypothetical protein
MKYTEPYSTKDLDIWIEPSQDNARRTLDALRGFGAPVADIRADDLLNPDTVYQIGIEPNRIDIMSFVNGLEFGRAWDCHAIAEFDKDLKTPVLSLDDIITAKEAAGRAKDRLQARQLKRAKTKYHKKQ